MARSQPKENKVTLKDTSKKIASDVIFQTWVRFCLPIIHSISSLFSVRLKNHNKSLKNSSFGSLKKKKPFLPFSIS